MPAAASSIVEVINGRLFGKSVTRLTFELFVLKCPLDSRRFIRLHSLQKRAKHLLGSNQGSLCLFSAALL
jgi:hypothetical protein